MKAADVALLRLAAQRLAGGQCDTPLGTVRWMTALQGQDFRGVLTSIALRTAGATAATVRTSLDAGEIVRSWPMRGTLHVVAAEDLHWMLAVSAPRVIASMATRRRVLGLDEATIARATQVAATAMQGGGQLSRADLFARWEQVGVATTAQRGIHLILYLALTGVLCFGPTVGGVQQLVLLDEWVPPRRRLTPEEPVSTWALRFFRSHGPATVADFARWAKLPLSRARSGLDGAREQLSTISFDGSEQWMDPRTPALLDECRSRARGMFLLPGFDEFVLGYVDRSVVVPAPFASRVVPGNNGVFSHTVLARGQVIGTWKRGKGVRGRTVVAEPFTAFSARQQDQIARLAALLP